MFCMAVTLYFAKEVPLEAKAAQHLSDSAPLLKDSRQPGRGLSQTTLGKLENGRDVEIEVTGKANSDRPSGFDSNIKHDKTEAFDGPSAVLVNLLTSLRHLPPGMHSVLLVMALTWVCNTDFPHDLSCLSLCLLNCACYVYLLTRIVCSFIFIIIGLSFSSIRKVGKRSIAPCHTRAHMI